MKFFKYQAVTALTQALVAVVFAGVAQHAAAESMVSARFSVPVQRYGHFALGEPHEYARVAVTTDTGRQLGFDLPADEVFEDLTPRIVTLVPGGPQEILAIVSHRLSGSRLMLLRQAGERLEVSAESSPVGTPMRWLNPVGVADLNNDGEAEIAAVLTPHIGGTLKVYRRQGRALLELAALGGFSNHVNGTPELLLSMLVAINGQIRLLVPDVSRSKLRVVGLKDGKLADVGQCVLPSPLVGPIRLVGPAEVSLGLLSGVRQIRLSDCT